MSKEICTFGSEIVGYDMMNFSIKPATTVYKWKAIPRENVHEYL